jgi:hypothetical protein
MSNITDTLKAATKDILTEDVLKEIEASFNASVNEKVKLHVEKALLEQDEDYAKKLETLVEAIDADHTAKLNQVVEAIDADRANKLKTVIAKYEEVLTTEAAKFKDEMVNEVSKYLELYVDEKLPVNEVKEAVKNKKAIRVLEDVRQMLAVDNALSQSNIRDAIVDGKDRLDEAAKQLEASNSAVKKLTEDLNKVKAELVLEKKVSSLDKDTQAYVKKMLVGKSEQFIKENFDYTVKLFDKTEEERLDNLKTEAITETETKEVDRPVIEESAKQPDVDPVFGTYMSELGKY